MKFRSAILDGYRKTNAEAHYINQGEPWSGLPTWACSLCTFTTTTKIQTAFRHIRENHADFLTAGDIVVDESVSVPVVMKEVQSSLVSPTGGKLFFEEEERGD